MIQFNSVVSNLLQQPVTELIYLVRIGELGAQNTVLFTSSPYDFVLNNNGVPIATYISDGRLAKLDAPAVTSSVDKNAYTITLADPGFNDAGRLDTDWIGKRIEIRIAFINLEDTPQNDSKDNSILPNMPYQELVDTFIVYSGIIDESSINIDTNTTGEVLIQIACASPMFNLDFKRSFRLQKDAIRGRYPKDTCCDKIYEGSSSVILLWGKS